MDSPAVRRKLEDDRNKARRGQGNIGMDGSNSKAGLSINETRNAINEDNSRFIADQKQVTMSIIKQQDEALLGLDDAVGRLDHMGRAINTELKEQVLR